MLTCGKCHAFIAFVFGSFISSACAAWSPGPGSISVEVIDDHGRVFRQFDVTRTGEPAVRRAYLEAVREKRYGVRVRNHTGRRIGLVLAVDGRNIISGERSNLRRHEPMYILDPWRSANYDGWRTSDTRVHRFFFTDADDSYAGAFGDKSAMGVIAVAAFAEKSQTRTDQEYRGKSGGHGGRSDAPSAAREDAGASSPLEAAEPGTGFGEDVSSHVVRVQFVPARRSFKRVFLKYEWRDTLVRMGFIDPPAPANRFWPEFWGRTLVGPGYAPYSPDYAPPPRR